MCGRVVVPHDGGPVERAGEDVKKKKCGVRYARRRKEPNRRRLFTIHYMYLRVSDFYSIFFSPELSVSRTELGLVYAKCMLDELFNSNLLKKAKFMLDELSISIDVDERTFSSGS